MFDAKMLLILLAIALVLFGAKRLRTIGSDLGAAMKGFKQAVGDGESDESGKWVEKTRTRRERRAEDVKALREVALAEVSAIGTRRQAGDPAKGRAESARVLVPDSKAHVGH
jgi:sec-independent protein translocase protein TatA